MKSLAKPYKKLLNYYNFVEYILPAGLLFLMLYGDFYYIYKKALFSDISNKSLRYFVNGLIPLLVLLLIGWLMYVSRFYQLFPGYKKRKIEFRERLAKPFTEILNVEGQNIAYLGKFIFTRFWELSTPKEKERQLRLHVNWVFLVQLCNSIMLSFIVSIFLIVNKLVVSEIESISIAILLVPHILFYIFLRRAAIKNMVKSNFEIIQTVHRKKQRYAKDIPTNLKEFLDAIHK